MNTSFKGSQRCVLEFISSAKFIDNLNYLIKETNAKVDQADKFMPIGFNNYQEAELKDFLKSYFSVDLGDKIFSWWIKKYRNGSTRTPNWDLLSTCNINNKKGILLIEAKAHYKELDNERIGKKLKIDASIDSIENHNHIFEAISTANLNIQKSFKKVRISRDVCYQLSNRIAHSWWLANNGIPVVLIYLGFLNVTEMDSPPKDPMFITDTDWQTCFTEHIQKVGVDTILNNWVDCGSESFMVICKSTNV